MYQPRRRSFPKILIGLIVLALAAFFARGWWLPVLGTALIRDDGPDKADAIVVLAGDEWGHRIEKAAELVRQGYAPVALISGPSGMYGFYESDLAIQFIVRKGYPADWFVAVPHNARSTRDEAPVLLRELRRRNVRHYLLVTSDFHTGRAAHIFAAAQRALGYAASMRVVAAPDEYFRSGAWWRNREAQKVVFNEWAKTIAWDLGI